MKLKKFDFKLPKEEAREKRIILTSISVIAIILIITLASTFAYYQSIEIQNPISGEVGSFSNGDIIFAVTIDGVPSNTFPLKGSGYVGSRVTCDKSATGIWDNHKWGINFGNLTQTKTTCNIEFINEIGTIAYKIKQQGGGASVIEAKGNPAFDAVPNAATSGIYAIDDEYGTSYYYRGLRSSLSNNVIFAGFQWKIVRINGDASVRLVYNGTEAQFNSAKTMNTTGANTQIGVNVFNTDSIDNRSVGYMYGRMGNSYLNAHKNELSSAIKTYVDNWYANNIANKGSLITNKIADNLFCNDRQLGREYPGAPTGGSGWNGTGFGTSITNYASYYRHYELRDNPSPTLKCVQKNDRFTVNDEISGNGALTYPVGLLSVDEVTYSGVSYVYYNTNQFLSTSQVFWTMSSINYSSSTASAWVVTIAGNLSSANVDYVTNYVTNISNGVRPVLNLSLAATVTSGDGSATNPFRVS